MSNVMPGLAGKVSWLADGRYSAESWGSGAVPVFATPSLVALMEAAAMEALRGRLDQGDTTVGTRIEVAHLAATPIGEYVRAEATVTAVEGRRVVFELAAYDGVQRIGEGRHERVIVSRDRFLAKLRRS